MNAAILGNGPSRVAYSGGPRSGEYDLVLGCNFPWTDVDATVIIDSSVMRKIISSHKSIIKWPACYLSTPVYRLARSRRHNKPAQIIFNQCIRHFPLVAWESSGHVAARIAIEAGATNLMLFGFDSYFDETIESYTSKYVKGTPTKHSRIKRWRKTWDEMIEKFPNVNFTFVRGN